MIASSPLPGTLAVPIPLSRVEAHGATGAKVLQAVREGRLEISISAERGQEATIDADALAGYLAEERGGLLTALRRFRISTGVTSPGTGYVMPSSWTADYSSPTTHEPLRVLGARARARRAAVEASK